MSPFLGDTNLVVSGTAINGLTHSIVKSKRRLVIVIVLRRGRTRIAPTARAGTSISRATVSEDSVHMAVTVATRTAEPYSSSADAPASSNPRHIPVPSGERQTVCNRGPVHQNIAMNAARARLQRLGVVQDVPVWPWGWHPWFLQLHHCCFVMVAEVGEIRLQCPM